MSTALPPESFLVFSVIIGADGALRPAEKKGLARAAAHAGVGEQELDALFAKAAEAPNIENEHGVPWQVVYGMSNNVRGFW